MLPVSSMERMRVLYWVLRRCSSACEASRSACLLAMSRLYCWTCSLRLSMEACVMLICWSISDFFSTSVWVLDWFSLIFACRASRSFLSSACWLRRPLSSFLISELEAALTMMMRALEMRPRSITATSTRQTIRRPEPLFLGFISADTSRFTPSGTCGWKVSCRTHRRGSR